MQNAQPIPKSDPSVAAPRDEQWAPQKSDCPRTAMSSISVCIVCRNEAEDLRLCLESVAWADEIVVLDLSSTDDSVLVANEYRARVAVRAPVPYVELVRIEAIAMATKAWILILDPDERVTPGLAHELQRLALRTDLD